MTFKTDEEVKNAVHGWLVQLAQDFFLKGIYKLPDHWIKIKIISNIIMSEENILKLQKYSGVQKDIRAQSWVKPFELHVTDEDIGKLGSDIIIATLNKLKQQVGKQRVVTYDRGNGCFVRVLGHEWQWCGQFLRRMIVDSRCTVFCRWHWRKIGGWA
ncbi:hypothetical protein LAZ67_2001725 [Cordylochernes scorpioides]|uniref:Uncharacterized protein n=1 Tax=Cordylochernes scorpioides TaxID=51811 RepID=A0ABY6K285_9ARAC|nr:hypothetical protein LAZ67_2001725 [Cordylochernes scorpioides]